VALIASTSPIKASDKLTMPNAYSIRNSRNLRFVRSLYTLLLLSLLSFSFVVVVVIIVCSTGALIHHFWTP
jgi:hypothetical protein